LTEVDRETRINSGVLITKKEVRRYEETVDGRDCYVIDMEFDPVISYTQDGGVSTVTSMRYWGDKATGLNQVKMETSGTYNETAFTMTTTCSYSP
jgi:hypothetical protein